MNRLDFAEVFREPVLLVNANGRVLSANTAFRHWLESTAPHSTGSDLLALFADSPKVLSFLRRCAHSRRLLPARFRLQARYAGNQLACEGARFGSPSDQLVLLRLRGPCARSGQRARLRARRGAGRWERESLESIAGIAAQLDGGSLDPQQRHLVRDLLHAAQRLLFPGGPPPGHHLPARESAPMTPEPKLRVLLVEDNAVNRMVASRMLSRLGLTPDICTDGHEAVERATAQSYDLILMDVQMPRMDGLEATSRIRALQRDSRPTRIIAITANTMEETRDACERAGMDAFLGKPFTLEDLAGTLRRLFDPPASA